MPIWRVHIIRPMFAPCWQRAVLGLVADEALAAMADFQGLPRQQEVGRKDGVLYVDDSISTTPNQLLPRWKSTKASHSR